MYSRAEKATLSIRGCPSARVSRATIRATAITRAITRAIIQDITIDKEDNEYGRDKRARKPTPKVIYNNSQRS